MLMAALALGGVSVLGAGVAKAYRGDYNQRGPAYNEERHQEMEKAFENNDYESWKNLMDGRGRASQVVNAENFSKFSQAHKLAQEGKYEEADAIRQELGLRTRAGQAGENGGRYGNQNNSRGMHRWQTQDNQ